MSLVVYIFIILFAAYDSTAAHVFQHRPTGMLTEDTYFNEMKYAIGALASAVISMFGILVWLFKKLIEKGEVALQREFDKADQQNAINNITETTVKELLTSISNALNLVRDGLKDVRSDNAKLDAEIKQLLLKMSEGFHQLAIELNRFKKT